MCDKANMARPLTILIATSVLMACTHSREYIKFPAPLNNGKNNLSAVVETSTTETEVFGFDNTNSPTAETVKRTQRFSMPDSDTTTGVVRPPVTIPKFANANARVTFSAEKMPLPTFINEVYSNILGLSFQIDPALESRTDGVTLRLAEPVSKKELFELANGVLERFGVGMIQEGRVYRFVILNKDTGSGSAPLLVSGRALPDVPEGHQTVFQTVPLIAISQADAINWLQRAYGSLDLKVEGDLKNNSVILIGSQRIVKQALEALELLDQPSFRGKHSARFELAFQSPANLVKALEQVLKAQGYAVSTGGTEIVNASIVLLPLDFSNSVLVFTPNQQVLDHVARWVEQLDQRAQMESNNSKVFYYEVKNTRADTLVKVLDGLFFKGTSSTNVAPTKPDSTADSNKQGNATQPTAAVTTSLGEGSDRLKGRITLDESRNAIVFQGEPKEWESVREVLVRMDKPARQVLVEVTVAEINLTGKNAFGVGWLATTGLGELSGTVGTLKGLTVGGSGLLYTLENAGQTRFILNAMASNEKVSILSTPKILVKSGEEARIDVGSEVPVITSQSKQATNTAEIVQEVQYRKTGVLLSVVPVVHSGNRVDLKINQEVSEAKENSTSNISSPSIFNRSVSTSVTLKDGGSVILAGLITRGTSTGETGIPVLKDVPILGEAFKTQSTSEDRKEMIILIRPYIIDNDDQAYSLTRSQQSQMQMFGLPVLGE